MPKYAGQVVKMSDSNKLTALVAAVWFVLFSSCFL
jgi:hypothetical protein